MNYFYLFLIAFLSATLFPMGSEAFLLFNLSLGNNIYLLFLVATFGNTIGSVVNYWIGLKGENYLLGKKIVKEKHLIKSKNYFDKYGGYSILFSWLPIIGDPITLVAGVLRYNFKRFLLLVFIAKSARYLFLIVSYQLYSNN